MCCLRAAAVTCVILAMTSVICGSTANAEPARDRCALPAARADFASAPPDRVALDPATVRAALDYANTHLRTSVMIFRDNCLVGRGALDPVTDDVRWPLWSSTKSVVSMLTGIAVGEGRIRLSDPIGKYLPTGWGDAAHRAITVHDLLSQTSGLAESELTELATVGNDPDIAQEALAQPLTHSPGTYFEYSQRGPDLLAYIVQRAVGEDLQSFAQRTLFDPLGIARSSYTWLRDRAGNTYGYAHLFLAPAQFAELGLLMQNDGVWNGHRVVPGDYVRLVGQPSSMNGCYGLLFWTNRGTTCTGGNAPYRQTVNHRMLPSAPPDLYEIDGALHQNSFIIPSLNMSVTWTGIDGDTNLYGGTNPAASDLYDTFFRILMRGVRDRHIPDPGPYRSPPAAAAITPLLDPGLLQRDVAPAPGCTILACRRAGS